MFLETHTAAAPWMINKSEDKMRGRINAMRYVLYILDYEGKDPAAGHAPDPSIVASAGDMHVGQLARRLRVHQRLTRVQRRGTARPRSPGRSAAPCGLRCPRLRS